MNDVMEERDKEHNRADRNGWLAGIGGAGTVIGAIVILIIILM